MSISSQTAPPDSQAHTIAGTVVKTLALAAIYASTAKFGLYIDAVSGFASLVWAPTGIALAAMVLFGARVWPGIALGAFLVNFDASAPWGVALFIAVGNTLEAFAGMLLLRSVKFDPTLRRQRDVVSLVVLAAGIATLVSSTIGVGGLWVSGTISTASLGATWRAWWVGDALGALVVAPVILIFADRNSFKQPGRRVIEMLGVGLAVVGTSVAVFFDQMHPSAVDLLRQAYLPFPFLVWASLRFRQAGAVLAIFTLAGIAIAGTTMGKGPFALGTLTDNLLAAQCFIAFAAITALLLSAVSAERDRATAELESVSARARFLAEAGKVLSSSLDVEATLQSVARLVVPRLGDNCVIDVVDDEGQLRRVAESSSDPQKEALLQKLRAFQLDPKTSPAPQVVRTAKTVFIPNFDMSALERISSGDEYTDIVRQIAPRSSVSVPMMVADKVVGVMTFGMAESGRAYSSDDLRLAEELGQRAGVAVERARLYQDARNSIQLRDDFLAVAGHELRTPLTSLLIILQGLQRSAAKDPAAQRVSERLKRATTGGWRLERLISKLLDVSRISAGKLTVELEPVDLGALAAEVAERFLDDTADRCELRISIEPGVMGSWDRLRLDQVITNLVSNAVKYGQGKPIDLIVSGTENEAKLSVTDHGIGISQVHKERIFDRFERVADSKEFGGLGLGLWISRQIVEALGGKISVESTRGEGSRFVVTLPRTFFTAGDEALATRALPEPDGRYRGRA